MEIITRQHLARTAAERWKLNYYGKVSSNRWLSVLFSGTLDTEDKYNSLVALGSNPEPEDVDRIIGNKSWTSLTCDECRSDVDVVIRVGEEPDYESSTAHICLPCISKLGKMVAQYKREQKAKLKENE